MRDLAINRRTISFNKNVIEIDSVEKNINLSDNNATVFTFKTVEPHGLAQDSSVMLVKAFARDVVPIRQQARKYTHTTQREYNIEIVDIKTFNIRFENYELIEVENFALPGGNAVIQTLEKTMFEYSNDVDNNNFIIKSMGVEYRGSRGLVWDEEKQEYMNEMTSTANSIVFNEPIPSLNGRGSVFVKNTWHLKDDNETFDIVNISIYDDNNHMTTSIPLLTSANFKISDDESIVDKYYNDIMEQLVPEIIDNEKRQFLPSIAQGKSLKLANSIEFNLHFRNRYDLDIASGEKERLTENWSTTDEQLWNGFKIDETTGRLTRINEGLTDSHSDELNDLGFTEDDIKFRKTKIRKSFLRLMFYSSNDPLSRELLYYSTIFLDSGELYTKYANIKNTLNLNEYVSHAFDKTRTDDDLRLSAKFTVKNKFNSTKSSEGFYLYLFPDEVGEENTARTIYMKVEFNHAGYGKTVAMMLPRVRFNVIGYDDNGDNIYGDKMSYGIGNFPLNSSDSDFPLTFTKISDNGMIDNDYERYSNSVMIPVNIVYSKEKKTYLYYFPWYNRANENKIIINLWEPRMRG